MWESLEARRLCAIVRPDVDFGIAGRLPQPPTVVPGQGEWTIRVVGTKKDGTIVALADATARVYASGDTRVAEVVRYSAAGVFIPSAHVVAETGTSFPYGPTAAAWYDAATDSTWVAASTDAIGRGDNGRPTAGGYTLDRIAADGSRAQTLRISPDRAAAGDIWNSDQLIGVTINSDGTLFATVDQFYRKQSRYQVFKFRRNGDLDTRFGKGGVLTLTYDPNGPFSRFQTQATPGGGVLMAYNQKVYVFSASGRPESTVYGDGQVHIVAAVGDSDYPLIGVDSQARTVVLDNANVNRPTVMRFLPDGSLDESFGHNGVVRLLAGTGVIQQAIFAQDGSFAIPAASLRVTAGGHYDPDWAQTAQIATIHVDGRTDIGTFGTNTDGFLDPAGHLYLYDQSLQFGFNATTQTVRYTPTVSSIALGSNGTLAVTGTGGDDVVTLTRSGNTVTAIFNGQTQTFSAADVKQQSVLLYSGDDTFSSTLALPITLNGGTGDDTLSTGDGPAQIDLGTGSNTLHAGNGGGTITRNLYSYFNVAVPDTDLVTAGSGTWKLYFGHDDITGSQGTFTLNGGRYTLQTGSGNQTVRINSTLPASITTSTGRDRVYGGNGDDYISTDAGRDTIDAGAGNDRVEGGDDGDLIHGNAGNDTLLGQAGGDTIYGEDGDDRIYGGFASSNPPLDNSTNYLDGGKGHNVSKLGSSGDKHVHFAGIAHN